MSAPDRSQEIEALIAEFQNSGARELHVRADGFELYLSNDGASSGISVTGSPAANTTQPSVAAAPVAPAAVAAPAFVEADLPDGAQIVKAPYLGTFYRAPKPGSPVYVDIGTVVTPETELCLVEVMKLFTAVRAGVGGTVHTILATDGQMVQAEQPLFVIVPA